MKHKILLIAALAVASSPVLAEGIPVEPGLWSITTTMNMPMMPQPQTMTVEECFTDDIMDMGDMMTDGLDPNCTFNLGQVDGNTMRWNIDCPMEGGTSHAEWLATSSGDTVQGEGKVSVTVQDQIMEMTMNWSGKRIGECQ